MGETKKTGGWRTNKWVRAAIPALLLHCSIGTVYCWSIFSQEIADYIGFSKGATEWAFSFAIFCSFVFLKAPQKEQFGIKKGAPCRQDLRMPFRMPFLY